MLVNADQNDRLRKNCEHYYEQYLNNGNLCAVHSCSIKRAEEDEQCTNAKYCHEKTYDFLQNVAFDACGNGYSPLNWVSFYTAESCL